MLHANQFATYPETYVALFPDLNLNPPWTLPILQLLAHLPLNQFAVVWYLLTGACLMAGCLILIHGSNRIQVRQIAWFLLSYRALATLIASQVYGWGFLASALAWLYARQNRYLAAAIAVGIAVALRPTMLFWIVLLSIAGYRRIAITSLMTIGILFAAPIPIYGQVIDRE